MKMHYQKYKRGQAILTAVVFFLFLSVTIIVGVMTPLLRHLKVSHEFIRARQGFYVAEALNEDGVYRLNKSLSVPSTWTMTLNGATATATLTTVGSSKTIYTQGSYNLLTRAIKTTVSQGAGVAFNYGIQAGQGGVIMSGSSGLVGNLYSNGPITTSGPTYVTGTAVAANIVDVSANQTNDTPSTPPNSINFRNTSTTQDFAQAFQLSTTTPIYKATFYVRKVGAPSNATVRLVTNNAGNPSATVLTTATLGDAGGAGAISTSNYGWINATFAANPTLTASTTYWLVIDNSTQNASNYYTIGANSTYSAGQAKVGQQGGTWNNTSPVGLDGYFGVYIGSPSNIYGSYGGAFTIGTAGVGDAWSNKITGAKVHGSMYCQTDGGNNQNESGATMTCDTSRGDPPPQGFPISDANIQDWKDEATAGGVYTGNYTVNGSTLATLGPHKIVGNLTVSNGGALKVTGTLYVTGNISISGGGHAGTGGKSLVLDSATYGNTSGTIVTDGTISISNTIDGTGQAGSFLLMLTTNSTASAALIDGDSGAVVVNAQNGTLTMQGSAKAKSVAAKTINMSGGTVVTYDTGLASIDFNSGPSGAWNVDSWQEVSN